MRNGVEGNLEPIADHAAGGTPPEAKGSDHEHTAHKPERGKEASPKPTTRRARYTEPLTGAPKTSR